ncbi:DsbA family protein [Pseudonocardia xinjiangensis]|uniref:DsbA family protein n=1 Tax=Pseudonocardia xinjiangensis TaxID=75289 RepID=UPI003D8D5F1F
MNRNVVLTVGLVVAATIGFVVALTLSGPAAPADDAAPVAAPGAVAPAELLVRPDSHLLSTAPDGKVTFVEFLDFECEACRAVFPAVEQLREEYAGRVSFVLRYFPIPSHANAENAAVAVEAAARQGRLEAMYQRMYQTQPEWGEQRESQAGVFRGFAEDLGLDMAAYDRTVAEPATLERVRSDQKDGIALGVEGTPTFFVNGTRLEPRTTDDLRAAIDRALTEAA